MEGVIPLPGLSRTLFAARPRVKPGAPQGAIANGAPTWQA